MEQTGMTFTSYKTYKVKLEFVTTVGKDDDYWYCMLAFLKEETHSYANVDPETDQPVYTLTVEEVEKND